MDEKVLPRAKRFNVVGFCLTGIRVWQWSSSFFVWASFSLLYDHIQRSQLGASNRMKGVQYLGLVSLVYSTLIICGVHVSKTLGLRSWRVFAIISLPGDLSIMGICLAKITILAFSGLPADCHGLTRDSYQGSELMRQPADGYGTIRFGSWATATSGELDRLCTFPRTVYGLSVVAIFSYTFTFLLSFLYIQQHRRQLFYSEQIGHPTPNSPRPTLRHVGDQVASSTRAPSILDLEDEYSLRSSRPHSPAETHHATRSTRAPSTSSQASTYSSGWGATTLASSDSASDAASVVSGGSLPPRPLPGSSSAAAASRPPQRRWSTSTSSSYDANAFIVTDGFRPLSDAGAMEGFGGVSEPPTYSSRPGSLYHEPMKYAAGLGMPGMPKI